MDERDLSVDRAAPAVTRNEEDAELIRRNEAFSAFYRLSLDELINFLIWQGATEADAVEIAQEAMIAAYANWDTIYERRAWVRRVASRAWGRRVTRLQEYPVDQVPERSGLLRPDAEIDTIGERHEVLRVLQSLPLRQRQVLAWTMDGYSSVDIADELGIKPEAVRSSLTKARRALATRLELDGGE